MVGLDCLFYLRRHGLQIGFERGLGIKIENRPQHLLDFLNREVRNVTIKYQINVGAAWIIDWIVLGSSWSHHASASADLNALVPLRLFYGTAIDFKVHAIVLEKKLRDNRAVTRFD